MNRLHTLASLVLSLSLGTSTAFAAVSADEAQQLKTTLTPFGSERAGNKDGSIPAWTGGLTSAPGYVKGSRRPDPFAHEKPLYSVTQKNLAEHEAKLSEGLKAMLKRYPDEFRIDVYPTHRTSAAPQWVYDNTLRNATKAKLVKGSAGDYPEGAYGGIPFPIPKSGLEAMWNHELRWRAPSWQQSNKGFLITPEGRHILSSEATVTVQNPYYFQGGEAKYTGEYWLASGNTSAPAIRAGEGLVLRYNVDANKTQGWLYLAGQRRVRKLPNNCCDTPAPFTAGITTFDEISVWGGRMDRFDWKIVGKQEMLIPYNSNRTALVPSAEEVLGKRFIKPEHVRWELHRVWVVEANLKPGQRHVSPRSRYYLDEDSWTVVLSDRWDAQNNLARMGYALLFAAPDLPGVWGGTWGVVDLTAGSAYVQDLYNDQPKQITLQDLVPDSVFTPDYFVGGSLR